MAITICTEVQSIVQTKNGILRSSMPGARIPSIVAMKFTPAGDRADAADDQPQSPQIGGRAAGKSRFRSAAQGEPADGRSAAGDKADVHQQPPKSVAQKPIAFSRGKAMSRAPIISGTR